MHIYVIKQHKMQQYIRIQKYIFFSYSSKRKSIIYRSLTCFSLLLQILQPTSHQLVTWKNNKFLSLSHIQKKVVKNSHSSVVFVFVTIFFFSKIVVFEKLFIPFFVHYYNFLLIQSILIQFVLPHFSCLFLNLTYGKKSCETCKNVKTKREP